MTTPRRTKIPPFPAKNQGLKFPNLERNTLIAIWVAISIATLAALKYLFFA